MEREEQIRLFREMMARTRSITAEEAVQDIADIGITVFGQPVMDLVANIDNPMRLGEVENIFKLGVDYEMIFNDGSYMVAKTNGSSYKFGPLGRNGARYLPGKKYIVDVSECNGECNDELGTNIANLAYPIVNLGGGGPNVMQVISQVFSDTKTEFIGTYSKKIDNDIFRVLMKRVGDGRLDCMPIYDNPPINIVFEGIGPKGERIVFKSPFPPVLLQKSHPAHGKTVMVNTVYNNSLAVSGLMDAGRDDRLGVLALTTALCRRDSFDEAEKSHFSNQYGAETFDGINSMYDFLTNLLLGNSEPITIMNEEEMEHVTGVKIVEKEDDKSFIYFDRVLQGLKRMREYQRGHKPRIYFTMGANGSLCCDEHDVLHYHGIHNTGMMKGKNAIGDAYAAAVLCAEHKSRARDKNLPASVTMEVAAATADAAVAEGIDKIDAAAVDRALTLSYTGYTELGDFNIIDERYGTSHTKVDGIRWDKYSLTGNGFDMWFNLGDIF